jgi:hypothetical protein
MPVIRAERVQAAVDRRTTSRSNRNCVRASAGAGKDLTSRGCRREGEAASKPVNQNRLPLPRLFRRTFFKNSGELAQRQLSPRVPAVNEWARYEALQRFARCQIDSRREKPRSEGTVRRRFVARRGPNGRA